ncbi:uncharacterized protein BDZ83DRAFT_137631 [Colletotrichum acutatum]|uniref:Uncharacterized protein n=1 Tax=Glomerella acutata TaxID=27357 RepID=A0AAD8UWC3_GLOAC|nr:uncharacterized protein BDZ83DRAFT_137631 [Colletotrichum acutatum]KAK1728244.1 hypothetical protein BDZ83DRAFT_137631 [Colletotrichum acutatum]
MRQLFGTGLFCWPTVSLPRCNWFLLIMPDNMAGRALTTTYSDAFGDMQLTCDRVEMAGSVFHQRNYPTAAVIIGQRGCYPLVGLQVIRVFIPCLYECLLPGPLMTTPHQLSHLISVEYNTRF